jgi:hypothetical protein
MSRRETPRKLLIRSKVLLIAFSGHEDTVNHEYAPQCHSVNEHFCLQVSRSTHDAANSPRNGYPAVHNFTMNVHLSTERSFYGEFSYRNELRKRDSRHMFI